MGKTPFYKKKWFIGLLFVLFVSSILNLFNGEIFRNFLGVLMINLILLALVAAALIAIYNEFVALRLKTREAWAQIDVQLKRRNDLIQNLVQTVKGYASHEKSTFEAITEARSKVASAADPTVAMSASNELLAGVGRLFAVSEAYPELKANESFLELQKELQGTEDKISEKRHVYNSVVTVYNTKLQVVPMNIIARILGFQEVLFFGLEEGEEATPNIVFDN